MGAETKPDFSGYATKAGLRCSDGRTIMPDAFKHQDQVTVPLVWQHNHNDPTNVLGHAVLEHRNDGMYAHAFFNGTPQGQNAKVLVQHKDIVSLSIYANQLVERSKQVFHGMIRELSLVLSGANPGALIDNVAIQHSDGDIETLDDEAIIFTGLELEHADSDEDEEDESDEELEHQDDDPTIQDIYNGMDEDEKNVVHYLVGAAMEAKADMKQGEQAEETDLVHGETSEEEGRQMRKNVFEQANEGTKEERPTLSHDALNEIITLAKNMGSLKEGFDSYALKHGIDNIDLLFPDARSVTDGPEFDSRRMEWVRGVLDGARHSPFSRIKSLVADLTFDEARARGYIKGDFKKEEWFALSKRTTTPTTVYKKQKLDRDDIVDITDLDVVVWLKAEMRMMLEEEIARAILIGDGRTFGDDDKIKDPAGAQDGAGVRSILYDDDLYAATITVDDSATSPDVVDGIIGKMSLYKGSGSPTFYTTSTVLTSLLVYRNTDGNRLWRTPADLAAELGVANIVTVEVMEGETDLIGIIVNLRDYTIGADKGGEVNFFDDFDIDYNQFKYLYETRISGALTKIRSALVIKRAASGSTLVTPEEPDFDDNTVTVATTTGVTYKNKATGATLTTGSPVTLASGASLTVEATPSSGSYYFADNVHDEWTFENES